MLKLSKLKISATTRIALLTGVACIGCCTIPWIGLVIGSASVGGFAVYSENAAWAVLLLGVTILIIRRVARRDGPTCNHNDASKIMGKTSE